MGLKAIGTLILAMLLIVAWDPEDCMSAPLTLDDVFRTISIDQVSPAPDGKSLAVVIQRPVADGEVFGRTYYEIDPSRSDVWLMARDGSDKINLTQGKTKAAGFWCAQWSPDGQWLAMLSTQPEGAEPSGGDAVRLYVWSRANHRLTRLSARPMMTQTRYGSPFNALDMRDSVPSDHSPKVCRRNEENAPFLWLDAHRLLVVQMPEGQNSALFTQFGRPAHFAADADRALHSGQVTTVDVADTDPAQLADTRRDYTAEIALVDVDSGARTLIAQVPAYPFDGLLSLVVSPDHTQIAVLAPVRAIPPHEMGRGALNSYDTAVHKRLGLLPLDGNGGLRWIDLPETARLPLDLLGWSPDSRHLALRVRMHANEAWAQVWMLDDKTGIASQVSGDLETAAADASYSADAPDAVWADNHTMLIHGRTVGQTSNDMQWWLVALGRKPIKTVAPVSAFPVTPLPQTAEVLARDRLGVIWQDRTPGGEFLHETRAGVTKPTDVLAVNTHLAQVQWGKVMTIEYVAQDGGTIKGLVILPPGYNAGQRYPLLVWVYPGNRVSDVNGFWSDPYLPGIYNLQLYAAQGYVVLVPSMPMKRGDVPSGPYHQMTNGVLPAIDKLVASGIADGSRVGVFGQSYGGYAVYALVSQTDRFAAAAAIAGTPDLTALHAVFDRGGEGWPGIAHDKSANARIVENTYFMPASPWDNPEIYRLNSPISHVGNVHTPLLMAHGTLDVRASIGEAQTFFTALYDQGKIARLLTYSGENHSVALSPANVRNLYDEMIAWFGRYLKAPIEPR